ncbi:YihY/virulence factor BrkB family protein [Oryzibacter oryziterrae]|uniref:YihY/virulence factor BrkB family protein n=1 Tax=Oryzibacter oryziterrae TaxID=2766474 RepID=UPI001F3303CF|nr:YihY/virulence factor BrkB family protein [Oryzibacter oryziterrae]
MRRLYAIAYRAVLLFNSTDGWAIASHVALSSLMALFPFLIFLTAVAAFFDLSELSQTVVKILFDSIPQAIAAPIAREVQNVLLVPRRDILTIGVALAIWFASSGVEALRVGLNRAYGTTENRNFIFLRLESMAFVLVGTVVLLTLAFLVILMPVIWSTTVHFLPRLSAFGGWLDLTRYGVTAVVASVGLLVGHLWLPAGRRRLTDVLPGIALTLMAWIGGAYGFSLYLADFANYASTYAGLAGVMTAIVFLYLIAVILLMGATVNAAIMAEFGVDHAGQKTQEAAAAD